MLDMQSPLHQLTKDELIQQVAELQDDLRMNRAFSDLSEAASNDAILQWRGRNRFLAEKVNPVRLEPVPGESHNADKGDHRIINGDNLSVMASLLTEFRGGLTKGIDVIYMDPPYNTGGDVFSYNDDFLLSRNEVREMRRKIGRSESLVSLDDPSRHTKWINHMAPRLWAARKLLKATGVIIISIDEHELPRLWLLMEEIFDARNRISTLIWERSRKNDAKYVSEGHEYMLVWARNKEALDAVARQKGNWREIKPGFQAFVEEFDRLCEANKEQYTVISEGLRSFVRGIDKSSPLWTIRQYVGVDSKCMQLGPFKEEDAAWPKKGGPQYDVINPHTKQKVRTPPNGWRRSSAEELYELDRDDRVVRKGLGTPKIKKYLLEGREKDVVTSVIQKDARQAVMMSKAILGFEDAFDHPKDHMILQRLFSMATWGDKDAVFLDPYAGSGTTGHAVICMNAEDEGNRRFIIIESGDPKAEPRVKRERYTSDITAERIRRVITGQWADGKPHHSYDTGFTFFQAQEEISRSAIMASTREKLADIILQVVEDDSNRIDCRMEGHEYIIGRTRKGYGIALVWHADANNATEQILSWPVLDSILDEADQADVNKPIHIYAKANAAPIDEDLYRFHQIPNSILARLGITDTEAEEE